MADAAAAAVVFAVAWPYGGPTIAITALALILGVYLGAGHRSYFAAFLFRFSRGVDPLTLRFSDASDEEAFTRKLWRSSYEVTKFFLLTLIVLEVALAIAEPQAAKASMVAAGLELAQPQALMPASHQFEFDSHRCSSSPSLRRWRC